MESKHSKLIGRAFKGSPKAAVIVLRKGKVVKADEGFTSLEELRELEEKHGAIRILLVNRLKIKHAGLVRLQLSLVA